MSDAVTDPEIIPTETVIESVPVESVPSETDDLEDDLKDIYGLIQIKIRQIVSTGKLTPEHIRPLLLDLIEIVQEYTNNKYDHIDGAKKKAMAMNILRYVFKDLHAKGQIDQESYEWLMLSLEFFGPALIDLAKQAWKLLVDTSIDISENGCSGCCSRNCLPKRSGAKTRSAKTRK